MSGDNPAMIEKSQYDAIQKALNEQKEQLEKATKALAEFEAKEKEAIAKARKADILAAVEAEDIADKLFKAVGLSGSQIMTASSTHSWYNGATNYLNNFNQPAFFSDPQLVYFTDESFPYDNSNGLFSTTFSTYTHGSEVFIEGLNIDFTCRYYVPGASSSYSAFLIQSIAPSFNQNINSDTVLLVCRSMDVNGVVNPNWSLTPTISDLMTYRTIPISTSDFYSIRYNNPDPSSTSLGGSVGSRVDSNLLVDPSTGDILIESKISIFTDALDNTSIDRQPLRNGEEVRVFTLTSGNFNNLDPTVPINILFNFHI